LVTYHRLAPESKPSGGKGVVKGSVLGIDN